ncbi:MAG: hypothetical protein IJU71_03335, partial [Selenomonadaceae bacterium]|nr:hypothetical protein [Selenomonadaceae bacterium]
MADFYTEIFPAEDGDITINVYHGTRDDGFRRLMTGGDGDNLIEAGGYFNTLIGGAGADTLTTRFSYVTLEGGEGDDYILVDNSGSTNENISHVVLTGGAGRDTFAFMPGEHTINATITDFDPAEDSLVLVSLTADGILAVLNAIDDGGIALKENEWGLAEAAARQSLSPNVDVIEGFVYDSDTRVAELHVTDAKLALNFEDIDNIDELKQIDMLIVDTDGNSLDSRKVQPTLPNGLSIYHSDDYNEDWLYVSSSYIGDVWLGGVEWKGADGLTWSDTTISDIHANNDTVSGRMLAGNANNNYIYAGSGGASMWGGTGGRDILYGGAGVDTFIAATSSVEGYTYMRNVGEEDVVRLELFSSTNIFSSGDNIPDVYLEGFSSGDYWNNSQYHWRIDDYDSFLYISDNGSLYGALSVYVNPNSGARTSTIELADGYRLRFDYLTQAWEGYEDNIWTPLALKSGSLELTDINGRNALKVNASYNGNIWLEGSEYFSSTTIIDAADDAVPNRMFVGNGLNNSIVASSR